jgi:hypothetical protein
MIPMRFPASPLIATCCLSACLFTACLESAERPEITGTGTGNSGAARLQFGLGPIGSVAKRASLGKAGAAASIDLLHLAVRLSAPGERAQEDTLPVSGSEANSLQKTYSGLAANKTWTFEARSLDRAGTIIHSGSATVFVLPGATVDARLALPAAYSELRAAFFPIAPAIGKVEVSVDGIVVEDSAFASGSTGDTVKLAFDYLKVGQRRVSLSVFGAPPFAKLFEGDTVIDVVPGAKLKARLRLRGTSGSAAMIVELGSPGMVELIGDMGVAACEEPVPSGWEDEFAPAELNPAWTMFSYEGVRHNNMTTPANHIAFTGSALRYVVDPMTAIRHDHEPYFHSPYYWYDPGLEITRPLHGTHWRVEAKVTWMVPMVVNAAGFQISAQLGSVESGFFGLDLLRYSNDDVGRGTDPDHNFLRAQAGETAWSERPPLQPEVTRWLRFERDGNSALILLSADSTRWTEVVRSEIPADKACSPQRLMISGTAWFSPVGSYADYEYIRFEATP